MNTETSTIQRQFLVFYHGFTNLPLNINSTTLEETVENVKKESPEIVILRLMSSNLTIQSSKNDEILNVSYNNLSDNIYSKSLSPFFGITVTEVNDSSKKYFYTFSADVSAFNNTFQQKFDQILQFNCLPSTQLLIEECQQFPTTIEHILETIVIYKNLFLSNSDNNTCSSANDKDNNHFISLDESITKCQKRKIFSPLFFDRMSSKRVSLVEGLLINNSRSQYSDKSFKFLNEDKTKTTTNLSTPTLNFLDLLKDSTLRESFMKYLTEQYCQENLSFYLIVKQYQCADKKSKRHLLASQIFKRFIEDNADEQINIDNRTRQSIINIISKCDYPKNLFDQAHAQIEDMLKFDLMPRFLKNLHQSKSSENNDKENSFRRKLSFNTIKNKLLKIKAKNSSLLSNTISQRIPSNVEDHRRSSLNIGTLRRSFVKTKPTIEYLFRSTTLSRSL